MLDSFTNVFPVFALIFAGYAAAKAKLVPAAANRELNRFVIWLALPTLLFVIVATTDWRSLWDTDFVITSMAASLITFALGMVIGHLRGLPIADIAVDGLNASYSNSAYIGIPLFLLALGPKSTPYVIIAATLMLTTLFACAITAIELGHNRSGGVMHAIGHAAKGVIRNPIIIGPALGLLWWLTGWKLSALVDNFAHMLGGAASPTALVAIGLFLAQGPLQEAISNRFVLMLSFAKLAIHPIIAAIIAIPILHLASYPATLAIAIAALPTGTGPFMVAGLYARDGKVTSGTILLSTVISMFSITAILSFLPR